MIVEFALYSAWPSIGNVLPDVVILAFRDSFAISCSNFLNFLMTLFRRVLSEETRDWYNILTKRFFITLSLTSIGRQIDFEPYLIAGIFPNCDLELFSYVATNIINICCSFHWELKIDITPQVVAKRVPVGLVIM